MTQKEKEKAEIIRELKKLLRRGDTVYTKLIHVSRSGMYRVIDLFVMRKNQPIRISWSASQLLEGYDRRHEGAKAHGCGMDMGFHLVYNLSHILKKDGYALKQRWL